MSDFDLIDSATGQPTRVTAEQAAEGLRTGALRAGRPLRVVHSSGRVAEVTPGALQRALASGSFTLDTAEAADLRRREREAPIQTGIVEPAVAGAASLLRVPTFGASRLVEHGLGTFAGEPGMYDRLIEENPTAAGAGTLAGVATSLGEGGGAGLLAPTESAGAAATAAIAPAGTTGARAILGAAVGTGVEAGLQGVAMEGGEILTEEALGEDPGDVADRLIMSGGLAGVLGSGLGGSARFVREGGRAVARRSRDAADLIASTFAQRTGRTLDRGVADALAERLSGASSFMSGADSAALRDLSSPSAERIVLRGREAMEDGSRRLTDEMNRAERAYESVSEAITGTNKAESVERIMGGDLQAQLSHADEQIGAARRLADDIEHQARVYSGGAYGQRAGIALRRISGAVERAEDRIAQLRARGAEGASAQAETFVALDELRRQLGHATSDLRLGNEGPVWDRFMATRAGLEDAGLWGADVARLQRETNAAWHPLISATTPFRQRFLGEAGLSDGFERLSEADSSRVRSYVEGLGSAASDTAESVFARRYQAMEALNEAALARHGLSAAERESALELRQALRNLQRAHTEISADAMRLRQWQEVSGLPGMPMLGMTGGVMTGAGAGAIGVPLMLANELATPARSIRLLQTIRRMSRQADTRIVSSVRGFFGRGARTASEWGSAAARSATRSVRRGASAYAERIADLERQSDPRALSRSVADATAPLSHAAPRTQAAAAQTAVRAVQYLQAQRPRGRALAGDLRSDRMPPSNEEMDRFLRVARAVDDPATVLDDLRARRLTPEAVDAIRSVYPALYRQIVTAVMREMTDGDHRPSYQDRLQLGILLGIPTDPALTPASLAILQSAHAAAEAVSPPPQSRGTPPRLSRGLASPSDRTEARAERS